MMAVAGNSPIDISWVASRFPPTNSANYSSTIPLGSPHPKRIIVVSTYENTSSASLPTMNIDGNAGTLIPGANYRPNNDCLKMFSIPVPNGTSGLLTINWPTSTFASIGVHRLLNQRSLTPIQVNQSLNLAVLPANLNTQAGGCVIVVGAYLGTTPPGNIFSSIGFNIDWAFPGPSQYGFGGSFKTTIPESPRTISANGNGTRSLMMAISLR